MIRFADVHTLLEDDAGELADFLRRYLPLAVSDVWLRPPHHTDNPVAGTGSTLHSLIPPRWPEPPPLRFNSLYWPTGATRWSHCFLLASDAQRLAIEEKLNVRDVQHTTGRLLFAPSDLPQDDYAELADLLGFSSSKHALGVDMFLLSPRPVPVSLENEERLWILPLVDERYYWQFCRVPSDFDPESWTEAFEELLDKLLSRHADPEEHYQIPDDFPEAYGSPLLSDLQLQSAEVSLDLSAISVGHRIVRRFDGTVIVQSPSAAMETLESNRNGLREVAGGNVEWLRGLIPAKIILHFATGEDELERLASDYEIEASTPEAEHLIAVSGVASGVDAEDVADQIAEDYFAWTQERYDRTFVGIPAWNPTGFDDCLEIAWGAHLSPGDLLAHTRVRTLPYNWAPPSIVKDRCPYYHMFEVSGGLPTSGDFTWNYKVHPDTEDVVIPFDASDEDVENAFLAAFSELTSGDIEAIGGPLPHKPVMLQWRGALAAKVARAWLEGFPTPEENGLDEGAWMKVIPINHPSVQTTTTTTTTTTP